MRATLLLVVGLWVPLAVQAKPSSKRPTDLERGKELYERHCVACHGATNHGDGPATEALVNPVPDLAGDVQAKNAEIQELVLKGRGAMPAFEASFDARDARRVLMYMAEAHVKGKVAPEPDEDEEEAPTEDAPTDEGPAGEGPDEADAAMDGQAPE